MLKLGDPRLDRGAPITAIAAAGHGGYASGAGLGIYPAGGDGEELRDLSRRQEGSPLGQWRARWFHAVVFVGARQVLWPR